MTVSPIKTVLRNVSGNRYSFNLGMDKRVTLLPAGGPCDRVVVSGDIFSQFREGRESDTLIYGIVRNEIIVSYIIEPVYEVNLSDNCLQASTSNLTAIYQKWAQGKHGHKDDVAKEPVIPTDEKNPEVKVEVKPEPVSSVTIEPVAPVAEEPVKEEPKGAEEVKATEESVSAPIEQVSEPVVEEKKEEESVEEGKEEPTTEETPVTKKRTRRVKLS